MPSSMAASHKATVKLVNLPARPAAQAARRVSHPLSQQSKTDRRNTQITRSYDDTATIVDFIEDFK